MPYGDAPPMFSTNHRKSLRLVIGLRDYEEPTVCMVFQANADGTRGQLLRVESPMEFGKSPLKNRRNGK